MRLASEKQQAQQSPLFQKNSTAVKKISLHTIAKVLEESIIKRLSDGRRDGVAIMSEGLIDIIDGKEIEEIKKAQRDGYGNMRLSEIDIGKTLKYKTQDLLEKKDIQTTIVGKDVGYELRCAAPGAFDTNYTKDLGCGAVDFLLSGNSGGLITMQDGKIVPVPFNNVLEPETGKTKIRYVDLSSTHYLVSQQYMLKLNYDDFEDQKQLKKLTHAAHMTTKEFTHYFFETLRK